MIDFFGGVLGSFIGGITAAGGVMDQRQLQAAAIQAGQGRISDIDFAKLQKKIQFDREMKEIINEDD